jgi:membrane protein DedA with SNARE-associated domain
MSQILDWLTTLPPIALYLAMCVVAAIENFFPPIPADVVVAFGSFLAARQQASPIPAFLAVFIGNAGGAVAMYALGRRFGTGWIHRTLRMRNEAGAEARIRDWYSRYGIPALFLSRFLPGIRAVVPPLAGAIRVPPLGALLAMAAASAAWYGLITYLAFNAGSNWEQLSAMIGRFGRWSAIAAGSVVAIGALAFWVVRRRRTR